MILLGFLILWFTSSAAIFFTPAKLSQNYQSKVHACICDSKGTFLHFTNGQVICYDRHHRIAYWIGKYEESKLGQITVYEFGWSELLSTEEASFIVKPRMFGCIIEYLHNDPDYTQWEWCPKLGPNSFAPELISKLTIQRHFTTEDEYIKVFYDRNFQELRRESRKRRKPKNL
ncbi:MAG: hypothetical protein AAGC74_02135 [Verrucomicrobiota bacterium]